MTVEIQSVRARRLVIYLAELSQLSLTVGVQGDKGAAIHPMADVSVATVAALQEYGSIDSPARPFMRRTLNEQRGAIGDLYVRTLRAGVRKAVESGADPADDLAKVGAAVVKMVRDKIDDSPSWAAPNADSTIAKKGHAHPLIGGRADPERFEPGGTMRNSITWAVRKQGQILMEGA